MDRLKKLLVLAGLAGWCSGAALGASAAWGGALYASSGTFELARVAEAQADQEADQEDDEMMAQIMALAIDRDDARIYADLMNMDAIQREIVMEMHREYLGQYREMAATMRDTMEKLEEAFFEEDPDKAMAMMADLSKVVMGFYERTVTLANRFIDDMGALAIDEAQQQGHERVQRARVRQEALALLSSNGNGEGLDLIVMSQRMDEPVELRVGDDQSDPVAQALLEYEREVHAPSQRAIGLTIKAMKSQFDMMSLPEEEHDWEAVAMHDDELEQIATNLREITDRYARRVQQTLPPERAGQWDRAIKEARYPQVYAAGDFERALDVATALDDLTPGQREEIEATKNAWQREAETVNNRWAQAIDAHEKIINDWPDGDDPTAYETHWENYQKAEVEREDAATARSELDQRFIDRIRKILSPEQQAKLPSSDAGAVDVDEVLRQMGGG